MAKTGSSDLNGVDDAEAPGMAERAPTRSPKGVTTNLDETEINAAGDRVPREPDDA